MGSLPFWFLQNAARARAFPHAGLERIARGSVSRVLSTLLRGIGDHSSRRTVTRTLKQSTRTAGPEPTLSCPKERSEEHTSELPSLMRISYAVFCLKKKKQISST